MKYYDKEIFKKPIFCDNHVLVVYKPANILTQPDNTNQESIEEIAKDWVKKTFHKKNNVFLHCIHRLDKPVSGLVIFARTSKALGRLNEQVRKRQIKRTYYAWVEGIVEQREGTLKHYLVRREFYTQVYENRQTGSKEAILHFWVLEHANNKTLLRIQLETGRYHQIRAQLGFIHHPIIGDKKYKSTFFNTRILLHQGEIEFLHPVTQEKLKFSIPYNF